jgi:hypothetical protein
VVPPREIVIPEEEGGGIIPSPVDLPLKAIVRIRIPLKRPVAASENLNEQNNTSEYDGNESGK